MKNKSNIRDHQEPIQFRKNRESMDPFKIQNQVPGVDGKKTRFLYPRP
jgi:hypothetical protein